ncbi:MAG: hypothetical protein Aurels2KO_19390 [Aureliella sp.]
MRRRLLEVNRYFAIPIVSERHMKPNRFRMITVCWAWAAAVVFASSALGRPVEQESTGRVSGDAAKVDGNRANDSIERLVAELSSGEFTRRRAAFLSLWESGDSALPIVLRAKESDDVQVAQSVAILEALIKLKIKPDENLDLQLVSLLLSDPRPDRIAQLCRQGFWELAESIVAESAELQEEFRRPAEVGRVFAIANSVGDPKLAWPIMRLVLEPEVVGFAASVLGLGLADFESADEIQQAAIEFFAGDFDAALARENIPAQQRIGWITRTARWRELAEPEILHEFSREIDANELSLAVQAALLDLAGKTKASQAMWDEVDAMLVDGELTPETRVQAGVQLVKRSGLNAPTAIFALLVAGRLDAIEQYLETEDPDFAYLFFINNSKYAKAFESLGLQADLSNFDQWLADQEEAIAGEVLSPRRCDRLARVANLLVNLGYRDEAGEAIEASLRGAEVAAQTLRGTRRPSYWNAVWGAFAFRMNRNESRELFFSKFRERFEEIPSDTRGLILGRLYPDMRNSAGMLLETVPGQTGSNLKDPNFSPTDDTWQALELLSRFDTGEMLSRADVSNWLKRVTASSVRQGKASGVMDELMQIAIGYGMKDLALTLSMDPSVDTGMHDARAARILIDRGNPDVAVARLATLRQYGLQQFLPLEIEARLLAGDFEEARRLEQTRMLGPLVGLSGRGAASDFDSITTHMSSEGDYEKAEQYARASFLLSKPLSLAAFFSCNSYALCLEELEQFRECSDTRRAATVSLLHPESDARVVMAPSYGERFYDYIGYFNYSIQKDRMFRAVSELADGQLDVAYHEILAGQRSQPHDIEMVVQCYAGLKELDETKANELFESFQRTLVDHSQRWPKDSTTLNNLAWMYAKTGRSLDRAAELAKRAVALSPSSDTFIDTQAEVYYQQGDVEEAIKLMQKCVRLNPSESHYRENLIRFRNRLP